VEASGEARRRRRLEARRRTVIRRRRVAAVAVAGLSAVAGAVVGSAAGGGDPPAREPVASGPRCPAEIAADPRRLAGQTLVVRMEDEATDDLVRAARRGEIGGVIIFPVALDDPADLVPELERLQRASSRGGNPPLLVMTDQEGGGVKRFPTAPPQRAPIQLGESGTPRDSRLEGQATGNFLAGIGINVDLAPVVDVPEHEESAMASRAFGDDPGTVARLGLAFGRGLRDEGVEAVPKHFPGLGRAPISTDAGAVTIGARRGQLRRDLAPFEEAVEQGFVMIMVGLAAYPALGSDQPAALSRELVDGLLRQDLGFEGVAMTDDLEAPAVAGSGYDERQAAVAASRAGIDLLLYALGGGEDALEGMVRAIRGGRLDPATLEASCARITALKAALDPAAPNG